MATSSLPPPSLNQAYVTIQPIVAGTLTLPDFIFVSPTEDRSIKHSVPSMCFLIEHPGFQENSASAESSAPRRIMFDLGLRSHAENYIPAIQAHLPNRHPVTHRPSAPETLITHGIAPESISTVILSHVHWDHHGDPAQFRNATFVVGNGSLDVVAHGMPGRGSHSHFDPDLFQGVENVLELSSPRDPATRVLDGKETPWKSLGPFSAAADLLGDGSLYAIPAPGHLPGHINLLCRTGENSWTYLGGDVFHDTRLLTGEKKIATWQEEEGGKSFCVHIDIEAAEQSIARIRDLQALVKRDGGELEVVVAHDHGWLEANKDRVWL
jgi:glyoxylase-like metal-dependent hydrolase (beta-lactamase superfamily II)